MINNDFVYAERYLYIKCPHCGEVAVIDIGRILTSMPPKYEWFCKHCDAHGYLKCSDTGKFESVSPTQEEKEVYEPQIKYEAGSIMNDSEGTFDPISIDAGEVIGQPITGALNLNRYRKCQICGKDFVCGPCMSNGIGPDADKYMCDECARRLKKLLYGEEIND